MSPIGRALDALAAAVVEEADPANLPTAVYVLVVHGDVVSLVRKGCGCADCLGRSGETLAQAFVAAPRAPATHHALVPRQLHA